MRQWRVGTFSMGLLLIAAGAGLLWARFDPVNMSQQVLAWWPVIFIILGSEILLQSFWLREEEKRIKYDVFSIIMIFIIIMTGMGLQLIREVGVAERIQAEINTRTFSLQTGPAEIAVEDGIEKIVLEAVNGLPQINLRTGGTSSVAYLIKAQVRAQSVKEAQILLGEQAQLKSYRSGSTLYLNLVTPGGFGRFDGSVNIILPEKLDVEIDQDWAALQVMPSTICNNWLIRGSGKLDIGLPAQSDLKLYAMGDPEQEAGYLWMRGNVQWTTPEGEPVQVRTENKPSPEQPSVEHRHGQAEPIISQLGQGTYQMTIIHQGDSVTVNQLP